MLEEYILQGNSLIIKDTSDEVKSTTLSGIIVTSEVLPNSLKKGVVLKASKGYWDEGVFINNPIKEGASIYYKNAQKYMIDGKEYLGTDISNVVMFKNK